MIDNKSEISSLIVEYKELVKDTPDIDVMDPKVSKKAIFRFIRIIQQNITDPRIVGRTSYPLKEIIVIAFLAILCGESGWGEIADFGNDNKQFLKKFLKLQSGIPTDDTFRRVFSAIDSEMLQNATVEFTREIINEIKKAMRRDENEELKQICVDGKEERGTGKYAGCSDEVKNLQLLHVYDVSDGICIYSKPIDTKTNEIPEAQNILKTMNLSKTVVTFDALHAQKKTIDIITEKGGDYVSGLKGNQGTFLKDTELYFDDETKNKLEKNKKTFMQYTDKHANGNDIVRKVYLCDNISWFGDKEEWANLASLVCYTKEIHNIHSNTDTVETRYYFTSLKNIDQIERAIRNHWSIEIFHRYLDVNFGEDDSLTRNRRAFTNVSILNKMALSFCKLTQPLLGKKVSVARTRRKFIRKPLERLTLLFTSVSEDSIVAAMNNANKKAK